MWNQAQQGAWELAAGDADAFAAVRVGRSDPCASAVARCQQRVGRVRRRRPRHRSPLAPTSRPTTPPACRRRRRPCRSRHGGGGAGGRCRDRRCQSCGPGCARRACAARRALGSSAGLANPLVFTPVDKAPTRDLSCGAANGRSDPCTAFCVGGATHPGSVWMPCGGDPISATVSAPGALAPGALPHAAQPSARQGPSRSGFAEAAFDAWATRNQALRGARQPPAGSADAAAAAPSEAATQAEARGRAYEVALLEVGLGISTRSVEAVPTCAQIVAGPG